LSGAQVISKCCGNCAARAGVESIASVALQLVLVWSFQVSLPSGLKPLFQNNFDLRRQRSLFLFRGPFERSLYGWLHTGA
jgi:hypothetical protein